LGRAYVGVADGVQPGMPAARAALAWALAAGGLGQGARLEPLLERASATCSARPRRQPRGGDPQVLAHLVGAAALVVRDVRRRASSTFVADCARVSSSSAEATCDSTRSTSALDAVPVRWRRSRP
jgi:hypothetical protein